MSRILKINAKCSDLCFTEYEVDGKTVIESDGYCPDFKGICGGDYVDISIDLDTGKIVGYDVLSHKDVMNELSDGEDWDDEDFEDDEFDDEELEEFDENGFNKDPYSPTVIDPNMLDASINDMLKDINP